MVFRAFLVDGSPGPGVASVKKHLKVYPLAEAANPPAMKFVDGSGVSANYVAPDDYTFWEMLNKVIQEEPPGGGDPTMLGLFASIGIEKGKPFAPDERIKKGIYFTAASITTLGYGDILLKYPWRHLGTLIAINGVLMFGCSTAFLFVILQQVWHHF